jgi:low affinity Fe/Cu permease
MFKRDPIFWWASGIFVLALVLFAITQLDTFLALMILAYLLRPTLASFGLAKRYVDERQLSLSYRSGNIAFFVMMAACIFFAAKLRVEGNHTGEMFYMVIVIGVVVKALFNVFLGKNFREVAPKVIISVGLLVALFSGMGSIRHGVFSVNFLMNILPGLVVVGIGVLSKYYPRPAAIVILLAAIAFLFNRLNRDTSWATVGTVLIIDVPLLAASWGLWRKPKLSTEEVLE